MYPVIEMGSFVTSLLWIRLRSWWTAPYTVYESAVLIGVLGSEGGAGRLAARPDHAGWGLYGFSGSLLQAMAAITDAAKPIVRSVCGANLWERGMMIVSSRSERGGRSPAKPGRRRNLTKLGTSNML